LPIANKENIRKKQKKNENCLLHLKQVKINGGPINMNDLNKPDQLTKRQLLSEIRNLKQTPAPNIREKEWFEQKLKTRPTVMLNLIKILVQRPEHWKCSCA
jgi:hypothetical protein